MKDCMDAILKMNDNDLTAALRYKKKKARQFSAEELTGTIEISSSHSFALLDRSTGSIYDDDTIQSLSDQDWSGENE